MGSGAAWGSTRPVRRTAAPQPQPGVAMWECGMSVTRSFIWSGKTGNLRVFTLHVLSFTSSPESEKTHL